MKMARRLLNETRRGATGDARGWIPRVAGEGDLIWRRTIRR